MTFMEKHNYNLPSHAQKLIETCRARPDFLYEKDCVAIYIDGYHHLFDDRRQRDQEQQECLEDMGYSVIRFGVLDEWEQIVIQYPRLFGVSN